MRWQPAFVMLSGFQQHPGLGVGALPSGGVKMASLLPNLQSPFFLRQPVGQNASESVGGRQARFAEATGVGPPRSYQREELGFSFSPAGLLFPYHVGVATMLKDKRVITPATPIGGSSAGALVAALIATDIPAERALEACFRINDKWRATVLQRDLKGLVHEVLDEILPQDAHQRLNARPGRVRVAVTELQFNRPQAPFRPQVIESFASREDLIEVLLASCCVPFWFTQLPPYVTCRGVPSVDGFFAVPTSRFGCPDLPSPVNVLVCPFRADSIRRGRTPGEEEETTDWLSPQLDPDPSRAGMRQLLRDALTANSREGVLRYFELGRRDAARWIESRQVESRNFFGL